MLRFTMEGVITMRKRAKIVWRAIRLVLCAITGHLVERLYGGDMRCLTCNPYWARKESTKADTGAVPENEFTGRTVMVTFKVPLDKSQIDTSLWIGAYGRAE